MVMALLSLCAPGRATEVGDTYDHVIGERGKPPGRMDGGSVVVLQYPNALIKLRDGIVVSIKAVAEQKPGAPPRPNPSAAASPQPAATKPALPPAARIQQLKAELMRTVEQVKEIVNQPVTPVPLERGMAVAQYPFWFHDGAGTPNFDADDVRASQEVKNYSDPRYMYATSPLNPGVAFPLSEMAFNGATKIFYVDRKVPKKKLPETELLEINRLYRIIGRDLHELASLGESPTLQLN